MARKEEYAHFRYTYKGAILAEGQTCIVNGRTFTAGLKAFFKASELVMLMEDGSEVALSCPFYAPDPKTELVFHDGQVVMLTGNREGQEFELLMIKMKRMLSGILGGGREPPAPHED